MTRAAATGVWASTLALPVFFAAVVEAVRGSAPHLPASGFLFGIVLATSAACIVLAQVLPRSVRPVAAGPEATAFTRLLIAWALCEGAALYPLVAWIVTDDPRLLAVCAVDLLALALLYPSQARWASLRAARPAPGRR